LKRIVSLWLPCFATDRLTRPGAALAAFRTRPLATFVRAKGAVRIAAANPAARAAGVEAGGAAADSSALCPELKLVAADPVAEAAGLSSLAEWCRRWTPWAAPEGEEGIWLDVSGCAHLFGGEQALAEDILARMTGLGLAARLGLADTPGAAWAVSRCGDGPVTVIPEGAARQWLSTFPVAALRLPPEVAETLRRLGLRRLRDLMGLPRGPLAARFGEVVSRRLDQLLGRLPEPISPLPPEERLEARLAFADPIGRSEDVERALRHLLADLCSRLEARGLGVRRLGLLLFRVDGVAAEQTIGTTLPVRNPDPLFRLLHPGLDGLDAGFGIEAMAVEVREAEPFTGTQADLGARSTECGLAPLLDRLGRRLGSGSLYRLEPRPTHVPERIAGRAPPLGGRGEAKWPARVRPLRLLSRPEAVVVEERDGVPLAIHRRQGVVAVGRAEGPERIAAEWWHDAAPPPVATVRDYWRVELADGGGRLWLFREGNGGVWRLHGYFA
jgi:protein ImuB